MKRCGTCIYRGTLYCKDCTDKKNCGPNCPKVSQCSTCGPTYPNYQEAKTT